MKEKKGEKRKEEGGGIKTLELLGGLGLARVRLRL